MGGLWGVYKIINDTLVVHSYTKGGSFESWRLSEDIYKIIDKNTIERVSFRGLLDIDAYYGYKYLKEKYSYISADSLPTSDCWLKEERWIWRNESDWKSYMERVEAEKRR